MINEEVVVYGTTEVVKDEIQINATKLTLQQMLTLIILMLSIQ